MDFFILLNYFIDYFYIDYFYSQNVFSFLRVNKILTARVTSLVEVSSVAFQANQVQHVEW